MKLNDYFISQKDLRLEPARKVALYESIQHKTHQPVSVFARMSFYTKVALYTFVGMVFLASLYVPYFSSFFHETDGILTNNGGVGTVQADYIAQIIETKGDIAIYNNGEKVESKLFRAGDRLVLPAGAEIVFHVTTIAQAKVIGPAEFSVEKTDQGYIIQLISGKYAEVQSLHETPTDNKELVGLRSSRVSIKPKQASRTHFTYTEEGERAIIDNQGETALVVAKTEDTNNQEELAEHSSASLASGVNDILDDIASGSMQNGDRLTAVQVAKVISQKPVEDTKKMISGEQHENIKAILSAEFLANDIQRITTAYMKGEARSYEIAFTNLYNKLAQIYTLMGLEVPKNIADARSTNSLKVMISMIEDLLDQMDNHYYTAQSHQSRLKKLLGWLYALRESSFGSYSGSTYSSSDLLGTLNLDEYKDLLGK